MPVAAVMRGGKPTVNSGSEITTAGSIFGWKMIFLTWVASSRITEARPTSEPVPAVVGTAMVCAIPATVTRVYQSSRSSKSHNGLFCPTINAMVLPTSNALPPPNAMMPSHLPAL